MMLVATAMMPRVFSPISERSRGMPVTLIGIVSIVRLLTVDMVPIAKVGIITIYVSAGTIIAVTIPAIGGVVIAMSAPIVGIVSKGRSSEEE
jgi:hypothetical protein